MERWTDGRTNQRLHCTALSKCIYGRMGKETISEVRRDRPVDRTLAPTDEWSDGRVRTATAQSTTGWREDREDVSKPAWKTTVFFLHPESSWRFRKSPLAVSFTWKLASDSLGDHNMVSCFQYSVKDRRMILQQKLLLGTEASTFNTSSERLDATRNQGSVCSQNWGGGSPLLPV